MRDRTHEECVESNTARCGGKKSKKGLFQPLSILSDHTVQTMPRWRAASPDRLLHLTHLSPRPSFCAHLRRSSVVCWQDPPCEAGFVIPSVCITQMVCMKGAEAAQRMSVASTEEARNLRETPAPGCELFRLTRATSRDRSPATGMQSLIKARRRARRERQRPVSPSLAPQKTRPQKGDRGIAERVGRGRR